MKFFKKVTITSIFIFCSLSLLYSLFIMTDIFIPSQKELENSKQLELEIIKEITNRLKIRDTLFLIKEKEFGVCGNDPSYNEIPSFNNRVEDFKFNYNNPCYFDTYNAFEEQYSINGKIIIIGTTYEEDFNSEKINFNIADFKTKRMLYTVNFNDIKEDQIKVGLTKEFPDNEDNRLINFTMLKAKALWKIKVLN